MHAWLAAAGGFLLAVLWMDLTWRSSRSSCGRPAASTAREPRRRSRGSASARSERSHEPDSPLSIIVLEIDRHRSLLPLAAARNVLSPERVVPLLGRLQVRAEVRPHLRQLGVGHPREERLHRHAHAEAEALESGVAISGLERPQEQRPRLLRGLEPRVRGERQVDPGRCHERLGRRRKGILQIASEVFLGGENLKLVMPAARGRLETGDRIAPDQTRLGSCRSRRRRSSSLPRYGRSEMLCSRRMRLGGSDRSASRIASGLRFPSFQRTFRSAGCAGAKAPKTADMYTPGTSSRVTGPEKRLPSLRKTTSRPTHFCHHSTSFRVSRSWRLTASGASDDSASS